MNETYIIQKARLNYQEFCTAWAMTKEQLFEFFHENVHEQLREKLKQDDSMFNIVDNSGIKWRISLAILPFYMKLANANIS